MKTQTARQADAEAIKLAYGRTTTEEQLAKHNKAQHSPLPWRHDVESTTDEWIFIETTDARNDIVCKMRIESQTGQQEASNARLIVASVNNADKLAEVVRAFESYGRTPKTMAMAEAAMSAYKEAKQ